ncbi:zinc finger protein 1-like [Salvia divinorum]|uniref:Zinc finger protein 1-like n=1 Tax=Salvia divinorum TaxID=28513 RepID=A0ABD1GN28_SALDI
MKKQEAGSPDTPLAATNYYCWFCDKTFSIGQALGGHKRKHYDGPTLAIKAAKCSAATHAGLIIDLNLLPPQE